MRRIYIPKAGPPEVLELREEGRDPLPQWGELRIRVEAAGVNFADVMGRLGLYPDLPKMPAVPGYEVAGRVDAVGDGVESDWVGRDVVAITRFGGYTDVLCLPEPQVRARPPDLSAEEAAAVPVNYLTAWQLLYVMGGLREGDTVLVHSAGGGVGIAATQVARRLGARVIGTASAGKHELIRKQGVEHAIDYRTEDFEARVAEITRGRGVELAVDAVGGRSFAKSYRSLAPTGRLGVFGVSAAAKGKKRRRLSALASLLATPWIRFHPIRLMNENKGVFGVNVGHLWNEMDRVAGWLDAVLEGCAEGAYRPVVAATFPFERAAEAHHYVQDRKNVGKVLLTP